MSECLFCKIVAGDIPAEKIHDSKAVIGFKDLHPQAKEHYLFIHKNHSPNANEMPGIEIAEVYAAIKEFTQQNDLEKDGFRVVTNINKNAGQTVFHTHFHVLGGEPLKGFGS